MRAWIGYVAFIVGTARSENLNATYLLLSTLVTGGAFALAVWLASGLRHGRRVGGAAVLVGLFVLGGIAPAAALASGPIQHDHPALLITVLAGFWLVGLRTLVALIVLLGCEENDVPPQRAARPS